MLGMNETTPSARDVTAWRCSFWCSCCQAPGTGSTKTVHTGAVAANNLQSATERRVESWPTSSVQKVGERKLGREGQVVAVLKGRSENNARPE